MDIAGFLARYPPFEALPREDVERVADHVQIEFFPASADILRQAGEPAKFLYVIRAGAVEVLDEGRLIDLLDEGDVFGHVSLLSGLSPSATIRAHEDTICYLVEADLAEAVLGTPRGLAFLSSSSRRHILRAGETLEASRADPRFVAVESLVARRPVTAAATESIREAATRMAAERVSCLVVRTDDGLGIVTDRDLRSRVLAEGRSADVPVAEVMSYPALAVPAETMAAEVLSLMLEKGFHHFPVTDANGSLIGVVTDTDLMHLERYSPFALKSAIERAKDTASAVAAGRDLPKVITALVDARADPVQVGHVVAVTIDALTNRLIDLAIRRFGSPPCAWAWLALGSAARHEQALHTDQDHALAFDPKEVEEAEAQEYFAGFSSMVTEGLAEAGIPKCAGGAMASNRDLRRSEKGWLEAFRKWMADPGIEGSILTSIVFDYRRVTGPLDIEGPLDALVRSARGDQMFVRHLARRALDRGPPTGFFRDLVVEHEGEHAGTLDVKRGGVTLITNLARTYAVQAGSVERRTLGRLRAAAAAGVIDRETREGLSEGFRLLWEVRLRHQVEQMRSGGVPDDFVDPQTLGPLERRSLKEAFRMTARAQKGLASELGLRTR